MQFKLKCNQCGKIHTLEVSFDEIDSYDREMGPEIFYEGVADTVCECGNNISVLAEGSEYPIESGIEINNVDTKGGKLVG